METTYASREEGGIQDANYMPNLTRLAKENISFSNTEKLGGLHTTNNTNWTMAALFAGTSGLPFGFPVDQNSMNKYTEFAPDIAAMGDIGILWRRNRKREPFPERSDVVEQKQYLAIEASVVVSCSGFKCSNCCFRKFPDR